MLFLVICEKIFRIGGALQKLLKIKVWHAKNTLYNAIALLRSKTVAYVSLTQYAFPVGEVARYGVGCQFPSGQHDVAEIHRGIIDGDPCHRIPFVWDPVEKDALIRALNPTEAAQIPSNQCVNERVLGGSVGAHFG